MKIRNSMYRMVFALIALPFFLFSLLITSIYSSRLEKVITESLSVVSDAQVAEMTGFCEQQKDYMAMIGTMDVVREAMHGRLDQDSLFYLNDMLSSRVETVSYLDSLTIIDREYRVAACSEVQALIVGDGLDTLIEHMAGRAFYISDVLTDAQGKRLLVAIARVEDGGELLGYTLMELSPDFYASIRENAELWNESTFYLLDGNQQIVSAGTTEEARDTFVTTEREREDYLKKYSEIDLEKEPQGSFQYRVGGKNYITYYSDVEFTDWLFLLSVNLDSYQAQRTVYYVLGIFTALLCTVLAVWVGRFASKRIVRPIKQISGTLRDIQKKQDYSLRVTVERKDEVGGLAGEINGLIDFIETESLYKAQQQRLLQEKAGQDALTKVLNRERISQFLQEAIDRHRADASALAVLFVDVDNFKAFNTNFGHIVGDQVLLFLSALLAEETGGAVGRVGGDEFLAVVEGPTLLEQLDMCLRRLEESAERRFLVRGSGEHLPITCSIGAVLVDFSRPAARTLTPDQLVDMADSAMYQVKNGDKGDHLILHYPERES